ncbi:MAG TPA: AMP-binding protein [Candidatus Dormibacteraeota bacterium]|nr:AMP-binding protein [Candidatus Dormibacteraeota bacterium]
MFRPFPLEGRNYEEIYNSFRWDLPERFNIGTACTDDMPPERLALIHTWDGGERSYTFGEITELTNRAANAMLGLGLQRGDRIAVVLPQIPETALAHVAAYKAGLIAVPLSSLFGADALRYRLADSGARLVVTDEEGRERIAALDGVPELKWILTTDEFRKLLGAASPQAPGLVTGPDDPCMIIYTSGTTGPPKGVLHGHRVLIGQASGFRMCHEFPPQPGDIMWTPADWAWIGGLVNTLLLAWLHGVPMIAAPRRGFDPEWALALLSRYGVRTAFLPTTALRMMLQCEIPRDLRLRSMVTGGEPQEVALLEETRAKFGLTFNESYGQTEADFTIGQCVSRWPVRPGSMGLPFPGHEVQVHTTEGARAAPGEVGEVVVRTPDPTSLLEYWHRPDATRDKFRGPWLRTGDLARVDEDGYFWFEARLDDVIKSAGYRIGPDEIEESLLQHPSVANTAVVGAPDRLRGQVVMAYVQLRPGFQPSSDLEAGLRKHVKQHLAAYQYPRRIEFVDSLPLTSSGKIDRGSLRKRAASSEGETC